MSVFLQSTKQTNLLSHKAVADNVIEGAMTDTGVSVYLETDHHFVVCPNATSIVLPKITGAGHEIAVVITNSNEITIAGASSDDLETQIETVSLHLQAYRSKGLGPQNSLVHWILGMYPHRVAFTNPFKEAGVKMTLLSGTILLMGGSIQVLRMH